MANDPPSAATRHAAIASWLFGSILLLFYMSVFAFAPAELPEFKHKMLAVFSALLCALFTFFFVGSLHVTVQLKNRWSKIAIQSGGGAAAFVLILWWWNNPEFAPVKSIPARQAMTVTGSNNTINQAGGDIYNHYGVPQEALDRLLKELDDKDIKLQERESITNSWIQKYKELESQLASRSDDIAKQAQALLADGKLEAAEQLFKQALANDVKNAAANAYSLAQIKVLQLNYPVAKTYYQQAAQLDPDNALYLNDLGLHLVTLGDYAAAEPLFTRSLAINEKALGQDHSDVATILNNLAELYRTQGRYELAEPLYTRSLAIWEKALGQDHPRFATCLNNLALLYTTQGRYELAEPLLIRSLAIREKTLGKDHPKVATGLNNLAGLYKTQGRSELAEPLYTRSLAILEKALGQDDPSVATGLNNLALLYQAQGRYEQAEPLLTRSLAILEKVLGPDHPDVASSLNNLAMLYIAQARYELAEPLYTRSLAIDKKALGIDHPTTKTVRDNLQTLQARLHGQIQVQVKAVIPDSPAEQLGLRPGDVFTHYHNKLVLGMTGFIYGCSLEPAEGPAQELTVLRAGKELVFNVKPGKIGVELQELASKVP